MSITNHPLLSFTAGDTWEITTTLLDENGNPYDLTIGPTIDWTLLDSKYAEVITSGVIITTPDPTMGVCKVTVPMGITAPIVAGLYSDALRLTMGGTAGTLLTGAICVDKNPWPPAIVQEMKIMPMWPPSVTPPRRRAL